jgi:hypothetical protein
MSASQPEPGSVPDTRFLVLGFGCTFVLAVLTIGIAAVETIRVEQATLEIADDSQLSTYYLGNVGEQLARLRFYVALGLQESALKMTSYETGSIGKFLRQTGQSEGWLGGVVRARARAFPSQRTGSRSRRYR